MKTFALVSAVVCAVMACGSPAAAQPHIHPASGETSRERYTLPAVRVDETPRLDGVLDDAVWKKAAVVEEFVQQEPREGAPASERTEVRVMYDSRSLLIGVHAFDDDPSALVATEMRRDADRLLDEDSFALILDTFNDSRNGYMFVTTPLGAKLEQQISEEGEGNNRAGLVNSNVNRNWDGVWEVATRITDDGWTAEIAIPLTTIRFADASEQSWGVNFMRNIRRKNEQVFWAPIPKAYTLTRVSMAGALVGLQSLSHGMDLKLKPYVVSGVRDSRPTADAQTVRGLREFGADAKYGVTGGLNLDLTYNTDFAQVEADQQQINLTRFNLVFPEKRPFFLENAGLFSVGNGSDVSLFYSRRIGISDDGGLVPITGGARLSGKAAGVNVGFLNMQTQSMVDANGVLTTPANNWTAARVTRELPNRSYIGGVFTNRSATGRGTGPNDWGRTYGIDGKWGITPNLTFGGFAAATETPGITGRRQHAFESTLNYNASLRRDYIGYTEVADGFNPEAGFLQRAGGYRGLSAGWHEQWRWKSLRDKGFRELSPHMTFVRYWNYDDGGLLTSTLHIDNHLDWENGYYFSPAVNIDWDGLDEPFEIYPGVIVPAGRYTEPHTAWRFNTDAKKSLWFSTQWQYGGFLSGRQNSMAPALNFRQGANLVTALTWTRNDINLPQGAFVTNLGNLRMTYNFSTTQFVQALVQYNDRTNRWSTNLRFNWIDSAGTGLFLVYNDTESMNGLGALNRAFIVKFSRQVDILR